MGQVLIRSFITLAAILITAPSGFAQLQLPQPQGSMVSDFAGKVSPQARQMIEVTLRSFRERTGIEGAVVTIPSKDLQGYAIEQYALQLGRQWGIGRDSTTPAFLLLVAIKDQEANGQYHGDTRLEISRHLEGDVPDALAWELIRRMRGDFNAGRFDNALSTGTQTILATIAERRGISMEGVDPRYAYKPAGRPRQPRRGISPSLIILGIFVLFIIISAIGSGGGRGGRGKRYGRRGFNSDWMLLPIIFGGGSGGFGGRSGSSWGGSSWGGGGSGDFGGFGGGGDFGGGGASDSW